MFAFCSLHGAGGKTRVPSNGRHRSGLTLRRAARLVTKARSRLETLQTTQTPWDLSYYFLLFFLSRRCQIELNGGTEKLKLRKTLHLPDTIGGGKRVQENPPPGTSLEAASDCACRELAMAQHTADRIGLRIDVASPH